MNSFKNNLYSMLSKKVLFFIIIVFGLVSVSQAQAFDFYRSLKIGDQGQDVLELQKILNQSDDTTVSVSGVGSIGNETTYFGGLTKNALIKFQNKYREQVLAPVGLSVGTGYFGPSTISFIESNFITDISTEQNLQSINQNKEIKSAKTFEELLAEINSIQNKNNESTLDNSDSVPDVSNDQNVNNNSVSDNQNTTNDDTIEDSQNDLTVDQSKLVRSSDMEVYYVSQVVFEPGQELTVVGTGINKDSEIYFFNFENDKVVSSVNVDSNFIFFDAPNIPEGKYELYIKNGNLISKPLVVDVVEDYDPPKISSVSPSVISYGDTVTIKGSNFESQNIVMTALGTYQAISNANGTEIKVLMQRQANLSFGQEIVAPIEERVEGLIQVQNSNGISDAELVDFIYN